MSKIKEFMNKPITWGDSCKWTCIVFAFYAMLYIGFKLNYWYTFCYHKKSDDQDYDLYEEE